MEDMKLLVSWYLLSKWVNDQSLTSMTWDKNCEGFPATHVTGLAHHFLSVVRAFPARVSFAKTDAISITTL